MRTSTILVALTMSAGCHPKTPSAPPDASLPLQIKSAHELRVPWDPAPFTVSDGVLAIDGRAIPISAYAGAPLDVIARSIARVPKALRDYLSALVVSATPNPSDAEWAKKYRAPVRAGMTTAVSGTITIYPYGLSQLRLADGEDVLTRNFLHELGHAWSLRAWANDAAGKDAWVSAIKSDGAAPSRYAGLSFQSSGWPDEDVAETTALYFLIRGTPAFDVERTRMPARFALLDDRFAR